MKYPAFSKTFILLTSFLVMAFSDVNAAVVTGKITDMAGEPLPYANVYIKNTSFGVSANLKGEYFLEVKPGQYTIAFSYIGYQTLEKEISLAEGATVRLNVKLEETAMKTREVVVTVARKDPAYAIIQNARKMRPLYLERINNYICHSYTKISLERYNANEDSTKTDSIAAMVKDSSLPFIDTISFFTATPDTSDSAPKDSIKNGDNLGKMNLIESISKTYYLSPNKYKEIIEAYHDFNNKRPFFGQSISYGLTIGEEDIAQSENKGKNQDIIYSDILSCDFNFYRNSIEFPALCQKPLLSPIAYNSGFSYTYKLLASFVEDNRLVYEIEVKPIFKNEALFSGKIFIEDSTWMIKSVDFSVNRAAMPLCDEFRLIQNYQCFTDTISLPVRKELTYTIKEGSTAILGNVRILHSGYQVNTSLPPKLFSNEVISYLPDAFDKDTSYWNQVRPVSLKDNEISFIHASDSIATYFVSDEYKDKQDSIFNRIAWYSPLVSIGHKDWRKGYEWYVGGLLQQPNPFGVGGYRHRLPVYFNYEFKNNYYLETDEYIDYGIINKDIRGNAGIGLTYNPKKFVRTYIRFGDYYEMINTYAALEQIFSRSNYVRTKMFSISQRMEIFNGFFAELKFEYSDQHPIRDMKLEKWSQYVFDTINNPVSFDPYIKSEINLKLKYRIKQQYIIKGNKKIIIGTKYPTVQMNYRKGIPGLFNSEVDYDYIEFGALDEVRFGRIGSTRWEFSTGSFINKTNLRLLEYKYFRGSDQVIFSDPLKSFQLIGLTLNTPNAFFRANLIHHFEGMLTNKIPLINKLNMDIAIGGGTLQIPSQNFSHVEMFAGLEKKFKLWKQPFRIGLYGVTADNTLSKADFTWKIGLDMFDTYRDKWNY